MPPVESAPLFLLFPTGTSRPSVTCMPPVVVLLLAFSLAIGAQGPLLPTLARLDALKLDSIEGDVPVRYSKGASRDVASALAGRIAECRGLLAQQRVVRRSCWHSSTNLTGSECRTVPTECLITAPPTHRMSS